VICSIRPPGVARISSRRTVAPRILTDKAGILFSWAIAEADRPDSILLDPTLDNAANRVLLAEIETIWLDRGYDSEVTRTHLAERGIDDAVIAESANEVRPRPRTHSRWGCAGRRADELVAVALRPDETKHRPDFGGTFAKAQVNSGAAEGCFHYA
jgi:hypothetical protein